INQESVLSPWGFFFSSRRRHTRSKRDWSSDVCSSDLFMGYKRVPWYSVRAAAPPIGGGMGHLASFLRDGDRVFLTYRTTGRGNERVNFSMGLLDMTPYGRGEDWEDVPEGWPEGRHACWSWRTDAEGTPTWGESSRPLPQWARPGAAPVTTLGRRGPR